MKVHMSFSIDVSLAKMLNDEKNKSEIINGLLRGYFSEKAEPMIKEIEMSKEDKDALEVLNNAL